MRINSPRKLFFSHISYAHQIISTPRKICAHKWICDILNNAPTYISHKLTSVENIPSETENAATKRIVRYGCILSMGKAQ